MTDNIKDSIIGDLFSDDETTILNTLEEIRHSGRVHYISVLIELLQSSKNTEVRNSIIKILSELKQTAAAPIIVDAIKNKKFKDIQEVLIRTCWENGLDYFPYINDFIELVITGDYMTAFESYTVIMNGEGTLSIDNANKSIATLNKSLPNLSEDRKNLVEDIIKFLSGIK